MRVLEVKDRTILVDATLTPDTDPRRVVVLVSDPSGDVSAWWTADQLPVEAEVDDGDLVTFAYKSGASFASSYRVTPDITAVTSEASMLRGPCTHQAPVTVQITVPAVEGATSYSLTTNRSVFVYAPGVPDPVTEPGTYTYEFHTCAGAESFDVLVWARSEEAEIAFAHVDGIPYAAGATVEVPLVFSVERTEIEIAAHGTPGTFVGAVGRWSDSDLDILGTSFPVLGEFSPNGQADLAVSPLAPSGGRSWVLVHTTPSPKVCESQLAWKLAPFDDAPFEVFFDQLAAPVVGEDGHMALASVGEVGDVLIRQEGGDFADDSFDVWWLHEDPELPLPLPAKPQIPPTILPGFAWPTANAQVIVRHRDEGSIGDYAEFTGTTQKNREVRERTLSPAYCD